MDIDAQEDQGARTSSMSAPWHVCARTLDCMSICTHTMMQMEFIPDPEANTTTCGPDGPLWSFGKFLFVIFLLNLFKMTKLVNAQIWSWQIFFWQIYSQRWSCKHVLSLKNMSISFRSFTPNYQYALAAVIFSELCFSVSRCVGKPKSQRFGGRERRRKRYF